MTLIENLTYDEERALYASSDVHLINCSFDGEADGESALKESNNILAENCFFNLRYPFWHNDVLTVADSEFTEKARAPFWYSNDVIIENCTINSPKSLRECAKIRVSSSKIESNELGWNCNDLKMSNSSVQGEYLFFNSKNLSLLEITLFGKYSLQYIENVTIEDSKLNTKDAFWHSKNVTVKNTVIKGEYLGWYSENLTLENCTIIGTQPLCYCKGLTLINCEMHDCDLAFEKSEVEATITTPVISIKNPKSGHISVPLYNELIITESTNAKIESEATKI
ncbi:MAG: DUF3737 family protein [Clostridia bacterium]|nr:DUF3737 family protein [Clostridia bacterium]